MRKTLLAVSLLLSGAAQAQHNGYPTRNPTKEETIEWLKPKIMEYYAFASRFVWLNVSVDECAIRLTGYEGVKYEYREMTFRTDFREITRSSSASSYMIEYDYDGYTVRDASGKILARDSGWIFLGKDTPPEMALRIENAIRHLASLCVRRHENREEPF
jgi:hypothetical protein